MNYFEAKAAIERGEIPQFKLNGSGWYDTEISPTNPSLRFDLMTVSKVVVEGDRRLAIDFKDGYGGLSRFLYHPSDIFELFKRAGITSPDALVGREMRVAILGLVQSIGMDFPLTSGAGD